MSMNITWVGQRADDCHIFSSLLTIKKVVSIYGSQKIKNSCESVFSLENDTQCRVPSSSHDMEELFFNCCHDEIILPYANYFISSRRGLLANSNAISCWLEDKKNQREFIADCDVPTPVMYSCDKIFQKNEWNKKLIVQPRIASQGRGVFMCYAGELSSKIESLNVNDVIISDWLQGISFNINAVIVASDVYLGSPSVQLVGVKELGATAAYQYCGNDFGLFDCVPVEIRNSVFRATIKIGYALSKIGYLGFFGLDGVLNIQTGVVTILEINPRMQASTLALTKFEIQNEITPLASYHLKAFGFDSKTNFKYRPQYPDCLSGASICVYQAHSSNLKILNNHSFLTTSLGVYQVYDYPPVGFNVSHGSLLARLVGPTCTDFKGLHDFEISNNLMEMIKKRFLYE